MPLSARADKGFASPGSRRPAVRQEANARAIGRPARRDAGANPDTATAAKADQIALWDDDSGGAISIGRSTISFSRVVRDEFRDLLSLPLLYVIRNERQRTPIASHGLPSLSYIFET